MTASTALDSAAVNSKLTRTESGVYLTTPSADPVLIVASDDAYSLPVGSVLTVTSTSPLYITAVIPGKNQVTPRNSTPLYVAPTTVTQVTGTALITAGLTTFNGTYRTA